MAIQLGDSVRVIPGVKDPDLGIDLSGWQGRVVNIKQDEGVYIEIALDSITLRNMPEEFVTVSLEEEYEYSMMWLEEKEVEAVEPRDREEDVEKALHELEQYYEDYPYKEEEQLIERIVDPEDSSVCEENQVLFFSYLSEHLKYPCIVTGAEDFAWEEPYVLGIFDEKEYEELKKTRPSYTDTYELIKPVNIFDDLYGMMARVKRISDKKVFEIPLWDLETVDTRDPNSGLLRAYSFWMTNYR